jgi:hypothetical protein
MQGARRYFDVPDPDFGMVPDELGAVVLPEDVP